MEEYLKINNFGPISELDIKLKPFMVFIGGQGTGKSTIAKLLTVFNDVMWEINILEGKEDYDIFTNFKKIGINEYFNTNSKIEYSDGILLIKYENNSFSITCSKHQKDDLLNILKCLVVTSSKKLLHKEGATDQQIATWDHKQIKECKGLLSANFRKIFYIAAERNLIGTMHSVLANLMYAQIPLSDVLLEYMSIYERAKSEFVSYDVPFLGLSFHKKESSEQIVIHSKEGDKSISLNNCSSGIQSVLPLLLNLEYIDKKDYFSSFVIEEPEQNLFPTNQIELLRFLIKKFKSKDSIQMIINTHSPYILSGLNISILAALISRNINYKDKVEKIIPQNQQIDPDDIGVYSLGGMVHCTVTIL